MVKCLMYTNYGGYGFNVKKEIYDYIVRYYSENAANHILETSEYSKDYTIINYRDDNTRFNRVLIEAFENTPEKYHNGYEVVVGYFECERYDGKESNGKIIFY